MMFHGQNILVSARREAFEAQARATRLAGQARSRRRATSTARVRPARGSARNWWRSIRIRRQLTVLEPSLAEAGEQHPIRDYADCR
jgi:hypothetical protein